MITPGATPSVAAQLSGTIALNVPGVTLTGTLGVQVNSSGTAVSQTFTLGGQTVSLDLPQAAAGYVNVTGTGVTLSFLGQTVTGDFSLAHGAGATTLTISNGGLSLAGGALSCPDRKPANSRRPLRRHVTSSRTAASPVTLAGWDCSRGTRAGG